MTLSDVAAEMHSFVTDQGWYEPDSPRPQTVKNLALSLSIEVAELQECYQWADSATPDRVADELADIVLYAAQLANVTDIDLETAVRQKLQRNRRRV